MSIEEPFVFLDPFLCCNSTTETSLTSQFRQKILAFDGKRVNGKRLFVASVSSIPSAFLPKPQVKVPGLFVFDDSVSLEFEERLLKESQDFEWISLRERKVAHFGKVFDYDINDFSESRHAFTSSAKQLLSIASNRMAQCGLDCGLDQLTVNCYDPGHGIPPHCDTHKTIGPVIVVFSFGSGIVMEFENPATKETSQVYLKPRSLAILSGESRFGWTHGIRSRFVDLVNRLVLERGTRTSFTFRQVKTDPVCSCSYPLVCDLKQ